MSDSPLVLAHRALADAVNALAAAADSSATDDELLATLTLCEGVNRTLDQLSTTTIAALDRRGVFTARGYRAAAAALADLQGWDRADAGRRAKIAARTAPRIGLDGQELPPRLSATAAVFAAGRVSLRHVQVLTRELNTAAAHRLSPQRWAGAEQQLAEWATLYPPGELAGMARQLIDTLDDDGPGDDDPPEPRNEVLLTPRADGPGGRIRGELDAVLFATIATAVDALSKPLTGEDTRSLPERQAHAPAEICGFALDHGDAGPLPECGGERPHLNVIVRLDDLQNRARAAALDFGGQLSPEQLRLLACAARVVPIVMDGKGRAPRHRPGHPRHPRRATPRGRRPRPRLRPPR